MSDEKTHKGAYFVLSAIIGGIIAWLLNQKAGGETPPPPPPPESFGIQVIASQGSFGAYPIVLRDTSDPSIKNQPYFSLPAPYPNVKFQAVITKPAANPNFAWYFYNLDATAPDRDLSNTWRDVSEGVIMSEVMATYRKVDSPGYQPSVRLIYSDDAHRIDFGYMLFHVVTRSIP